MMKMSVICPICKSKDVNSGTQGSGGIDSTGRISWSGFFQCNTCGSMFSKTEITKNDIFIQEEYEIYHSNIKKVRKMKLDELIKRI